MALQPGTTLGPYAVTAKIGEGGMGEVYKATDTRLDRTVAIKVLPEHVADSPDLKQRFEREAKTISSLNHPHICTLYDIGNQDGIDFLVVMEYLDGETLAQRLEKGAHPIGWATGDLLGNSPVDGRLSGALGGRYARRRDDAFQEPAGVSRDQRRSASHRTFYPDRRPHHRLPVHH